MMDKIVFCEDSEFDMVVAHMHFDGLPTVVLNVTEVSADERETRVASLYRQIERVAAAARGQGGHEVRTAMRELLGLV